jgi:CXXC-20-CXXC protein
MARCKKCNETLSVKAVSFMSKRNNIIECKKCNTFLEGDKKQLAILGGIGGAIAGSFGFLTVYSLTNKSGFTLLFLVIVIITLLVGAVIQNQIIKLNVK